MSSAVQWLVKCLLKGELLLVIQREDIWANELNQMQLSTVNWHSTEHINHHCSRYRTNVQGMKAKHLPAVKYRRKLIVAFTITVLSCRRGTARRSKSVEILSTAAWLYEKSHLKRLVIGEWPLTLNVTQGNQKWHYPVGHTLLSISGLR